MKKCIFCGEPITDKRCMVTVIIGRWFRRRRKHFHIDCFLADKRSGYRTVGDMTKS